MNLSRSIDALARSAWRAWDGANVAWNGAFVIATSIGTAVSLIVFGFVIDKDTPLVLLGPFLAWGVLAYLIKRGKGLEPLAAPVRPRRVPQSSLGGGPASAGVPRLRLGVGLPR